MASRLIYAALLLLFVCCTVSSPLSKDDYSCTHKEKCEELCGVGQGWCLGGWCACARKRDVVPRCTLESDCVDRKCPELKIARCLWNLCLCIEAH